MIPPCRGRDVRVEAARVDADADRQPAVLGLARDRLDLVGFADVAGIEAEGLDTRFDRREREPVLEVDVRDDRHGRARHDLGETLGRLLLVARAPHDVATRRRERVDLRERAVDVGGLRRGHRLHRHGRVAADQDGADGNLAGGAAGLHTVRLGPGPECPRARAVEIRCRRPRPQGQEPPIASRTSSRIVESANARNSTMNTVVTGTSLR